MLQVKNFSLTLKKVTANTRTVSKPYVIQEEQRTHRQPRAGQWTAPLHVLRKNHYNIRYWVWDERGSKIGFPSFRKEIIELSSCLRPVCLTLSLYVCVTVCLCIRLSVSAPLRICLYLSVSASLCRLVSTSLSFFVYVRVSIRLSLSIYCTESSFTGTVPLSTRPLLSPPPSLNSSRLVPPLLPGSLVAPHDHADPPLERGIGQNAAPGDGEE